MELRSLTPGQIVAFEEGLALAASLVREPLPLSADHVQKLYDTALQIRPTPENMQLAIGLAFGEMIAAKSDYEWVRVIDEYGEETALSPPGLMLACHPISMIQKRLTDAEVVQIADLCDAVIASIEEQRVSGDYSLR